MEKLLTFMKNNKLTYITLCILGSILIGALGSGVWEYLLKPFFSHSINFILDVSTLGMDKFKNSIYEEVSQGFSEKNSISTYSFITMIYLGFLFTMILILFRKIKNKKINLDEEDNAPKEFNNSYQKLIKIFYILSSLSILLFMIIMVQNIKLQYINTSIIYYKQLLNIVAPYLSEQEIKIYNSKFSLIKNKEEYEKLVDELYDISYDNKLEFKKRDIW
ncbi:hypothetical protein [Aliarcobacter butzleri]|uniref:hypothetical protein n=1 Tax=Aliarcobacter butzleri TaxID=28197 RepID=UPI00263F1E86|nr:hypothetical protein [Aliarcobacter butzleri]MDN5068036.1 hypothetical protein [Aliarcobacter butzleri]